MSGISRKRLRSRERGACGAQGSEKGDFLQAQRREKMRLFMQEFVQQGKQIVADLKKRGQTLVSTTEKAFAVELLKMPTAIRQMKRKDFLSIKGDQEAAVAAIVELDDLSIMKVETKNSKRSKAQTRAVEHQEHKSPKTRSVSTTAKKRAFQKATKSKSRIASSSSRDNKQTNSLPRYACSTPITKSYKKAFSATTVGLTSRGSPCMPKRAFETPILRSVCSAEKIQSASLNGSQSVDLLVPFVNIPLTDGQTLWSTGDDLETIDIELIHGDTVQHIHNLASQLRAFCGKVAANQLHENTP